MGRAGCSQKKCPHEAKPRANSFGNAPTLRVLPGKPLADFICFHFSPDTHWASWKKKTNQRPCIIDNEIPVQWEEQAFHFCKALLDYFSVKGGFLVIRSHPRERVLPSIQRALYIGEGPEFKPFPIWDLCPRPVGRGNPLKITKGLVLTSFSYLK